VPDPPDQPDAPAPLDPPHSGERVLAGGLQTLVTERDGIVYRSPKPQSPTVLALLRHLAHVGFDAAPRPVGDGFAADGREALVYLEGESPQPVAWSDEAAWTIGRLLRDLHAATASFTPPDDARWQPWFARDLPGTRPVIGHGDLGPWNVLAVDELPVAFVDWDNAGPVDAAWELAQVGWLNAQLHDDDVAERNGLPSATARARQLGLIVDGYELARDERPSFVDKLIEMAVRAARQEAIDHDIGPESDAVAADGFPVLWGITWRARGAAWMLEHRPLLERAIGAAS
jgi:hypothetical protein